MQILNNNQARFLVELKSPCIYSQSNQDGIKTILYFQNNQDGIPSHNFATLNYHLILCLHYIHDAHLHYTAKLTFNFSLILYLISYPIPFLLSLSLSLFFETLCVSLFLSDLLPLFSLLVSLISCPTLFLLPSLSLSSLLPVLFSLFLCHPSPR